MRNHKVSEYLPGKAGSSGAARPHVCGILLLALSPGKEACVVPEGTHTLRNFTQHSASLRAGLSWRRPACGTHVFVVHAVMPSREILPVAERAETSATIYAPYSVLLNSMVAIVIITAAAIVR
jgi:hypothetical protein